VLPASQMVLQQESSQGNFGRGREENCNMDVSGMLSFLPRRPESVLPAPNIPQGNTPVLRALRAFPDYLYTLPA